MTQQDQQPTYSGYQIPGDSMGLTTTRQGINLAPIALGLAALATVVAVVAVVFALSSNGKPSELATGIAANVTHSPATQDSSEAANLTGAQTGAQSGTQSATGDAAAPFLKSTQSTSQAATAAATNTQEAPTATPSPLPTANVGLLLVPVDPSNTVAYVGSVTGIPLVLMADADAKSVNISLEDGQGSIETVDDLNKTDCSQANSSSKKFEKTVPSNGPLYLLYCPPRDGELKPNTLGTVAINVEQKVDESKQSPAKSQAHIELRRDYLTVDVHQDSYEEKANPCPDPAIPFTVVVNSKVTQAKSPFYQVSLSVEKGSIIKDGNKQQGTFSLPVPPSQELQLCFAPPLATDPKQPIALAAYPVTIAFDKPFLGQGQTDKVSPVVQFKGSKLRKSPSAENDDNVVQDSSGKPVVLQKSFVVVKGRQQGDVTTIEWVYVHWQDFDGWVNFKVATPQPVLDLNSLPEIGLSN